MSRRWLRLDAQWCDTEWVAMLDPGAQLAWIKLLCYVKLAGSKGAAHALSTKVAAKKWDLPVKAVSQMLEAAEKDGALVVGTEWEVSKWVAYQEPERVAARERKRRQRAREQVGQDPGGDVTMSRVTPVTSRVTPSRDHRPPTGDRLPPSSEGGSPRTRASSGDEVFGNLDPIAVASIKGLYGWDGSEGTDERVWGTDPIDRKRCLTIAVSRIEGEGAKYAGKFFRRVLADVIAEQRAEATGSGSGSAWTAEDEDRWQEGIA